MIINHIEKPGTELASIHITANFFKTGDASEYATAELYTDLLLSGAGQYSRSEFLDAINRLGASVGISAYAGNLTVTIETLAKKLPAVLTLVKTMIIDPNFATSEITRAQKTAHNALQTYKEQARPMAEEAFLRALYTAENPVYPHSPNETETAIAAVTRASVVSLHTHIWSQPLTVTIGGTSATAKKVLDVIKTIHRPVETEPSLSTPILKPVKKTPPKLLTTNIPSSQNVEFSIGGKLELTYQSPDMPAFLFGLTVLGKWGGFAGRLMSTVREKEGLTYGIYARIDNTSVDSSGHFRIMTFFAPKDCVQGILSIRREIAAITTKGITENELARFKQILRTGHVLMFDSLIQLTAGIHNQQVRGLSYSEYQAFYAALEKLTRTEVNRALKTHLDPKMLTISAAGPVTPLLTTLKKLAT